MKVITLGNGFIAKHLPYVKIINRIMSDQSQIGSLLEYHKPDVIVNCIGFCGQPNIDQCEIKKEKTIITNTILPTLLAMECKSRGIHFIQIGSGCIFDGESPNKNKHLTERPNNKLLPSDPNYFYSAFELADTGWKETDFANPQSFYSKTKYAADLAIGDLSNTTVLRIRMPLSDKDDPRNLINKLRGYDKIINIPNSMTFMDDLVRCVDHVIQHKLTGVYHVANPQPLTATQIMRVYQESVDPEFIFTTIGEQQLDQLTVAKRSNCILNCDKLNNTGFTISPSQEALDRCLASYAKNLRKTHVE